MVRFASKATEVQCCRELTLWADFVVKVAGEPGTEGVAGDIWPAVVAAGAAGGCVAMASSEDHYLWANMLEVTRARNIPATLVRYRINSRGLTANNVNSRARTHQIRERSWARVGVRYDLYDDDRAVDIAQFVSGGDVARVDGRAAAYRTLLVLLRRFLVSGKPMAREEDREDARRLTKATVRRVLACPPEDFPSMVAICQLTWPLDRWETIGALTRHLLHKFQFHWHILYNRSE